MVCVKPLTACLLETCIYQWGKQAYRSLAMQEVLCMDVSKSYWRISLCAVLWMAGCGWLGLEEGVKASERTVQEGLQR